MFCSSGTGSSSKRDVLVFLSSDSRSGLGGGVLV